MYIFRAVGIYTFFIVFVILFVSCNSQVSYSSPPGYDLEHPVKVFLKSDLSEISGIIYYPKDTSVFSISDATGSLYKIFPDRSGLIQKWKFGTNHDYEDLQKVDSTFYILSSKGDIVTVKFNINSPMQVNNYQINDKEKNEFETLYFDSALNKLVLICKDCKEDKKSSVSTRAFDIATNTYTDGPYKIDVKKIDKLINLKEAKFKPSAAATNPLTHELYILSSVNKLLVIADKNGNVKTLYQLRPSIYKQPEGMAFTPAGDLLISNESGKQGDADISVIKHKK